MISAVKSLKIRFFLGALIIIIITIVGTAALFNVGLDRYFTDFQLEETLRDLEDLESRLNGIYEETGSLNEVRREIREYARLNDLNFHPAHGGMGGRMRDNDRAEGKEGMMRESMMRNLPEEGYEIYVDDHYLGLISWPERDERSALAAEIEERTEAFISSINAFLIPLAGVVILAAAAMTYYLGSRLTRPLENFIGAVKKMRKGEYDIEISAVETAELEDLAEEISELGDRLQYLEKVRRESASDFSHELRTPLNNILNYLTAIEDGVLTPDEETIDELLDETQRLIDLTDRLDDLASAEEKINTLKGQPLDVSEFLKELKDIYKKKAEKAGLDFEADFAIRDRKISLDRDGLRTILDNLLSNAIKYTDPGGKVYFSASQKSDEITIEVRDTGIGIDEEELDLIFERFYRTDKSRRRETGGSGIGLAITREMVDAMNGDIFVESAKSGTAFNVKIPVKILK